MSAEEIQEQHDKVNTMADQIDGLKKAFKLWPLFSVAGSLLAGAFFLGVWLVRYDNNVAKKSDIDRIATQNTLLSKQVSDLTAAFNGHLEKGNITKANFKTSIDSLARVVTNIQKIQTRFFTESYPNGRNKYPNINPVN